MTCLFLLCLPNITKLVKIRIVIFMLGKGKRIAFDILQNFSLAKTCKRYLIKENGGFTLIKMHYGVKLLRSFTGRFSVGQWVIAKKGVWQSILSTPMLLVTWVFLLMTHSISKLLTVKTFSFGNTRGLILGLI